MNQLERLGFANALQDFYGLEKAYLARTLAELVFAAPRTVYFSTKSHGLATYIANIRTALKDSGLHITISHEGAGYSISATDALKVIAEIQAEYCTQPAPLPRVEPTASPMAAVVRKANDRRWR